MGFTTEEFVDKVAWRLGRFLSDDIESEKPPVLEEPDRSYREEYSNVDMSKLHTMIEKYDKAGTGKIEFKVVTFLLVTVEYHFFMWDLLMLYSMTAKTTSIDFIDRFVIVLFFVITLFCHLLPFSDWRFVR